MLGDGRSLILSSESHKKLQDIIGKRLIDLGTNPNNDRTLTSFLVLASVLLTLVSWYTTYMGLKKYFDYSILALMAGISIQALLFAASWRIGAALASKYFNTSLIFVYFITMTISVFFSYSSLLDVIYPKHTRVQDSSDLVARRSSQAAIAAGDSLRKKIVERQSKLLDSIEIWATDVRSIPLKLKEDAGLNVEQTAEEMSALDRTAEIEKHAGGTAKQWTPPGKGREFERINKRKTEADRQAAANRATRRVLAEAINKFELLIKSLQRPQNAMPSGSEIASACSTLESIVKSIDRTSEIDIKCSYAKNFIPELNSIRVQLGSLPEAEALCNKIGKNGASNIEADFEACVNKIESLGVGSPISERELGHPKNLARWTGVSAHEFTVAIGLLFVAPHPLAAGSLAIAFVIDFLVLLCAFLGARPRSYFDLRRPSDLYGYEQEAIRTALEVTNQGEKSEDSPLAKEIIKLLKAIKFDAKLINDGFAGFVDPTEVGELKWTLPTLIALQLAEIRTTDKKIEVVALRIRLILWLADEVTSHRQSKEINLAMNRVL